MASKQDVLRGETWHFERNPPWMSVQHVGAISAGTLNRYRASTYHSTGLYHRYRRGGRFAPSWVTLTPRGKP